MNWRNGTNACAVFRVVLTVLSFHMVAIANAMSVVAMIPAEALDNMNSINPETCRYRTHIGVYLSNFKETLSETATQPPSVIPKTPSAEQNCENQSVSDWTCSVFIVAKIRTLKKISKAKTKVTIRLWVLRRTVKVHKDENTRRGHLHWPISTQEVALLEHCSEIGGNDKQHCRQAELYDFFFH